MLLCLLGGFNWSVLRQEQLRRGGAEVLLELAPRDPRALLLGDYMELRYLLQQDVADALEQTRRNDMPSDIMVILLVRADNTAVFARLDDGAPLAENELRLRCRLRNFGVRVAAKAFYFQEGHAALYEKARYGELRVGEDGASLLVFLRDASLQRILPRDY
jgi:uncharacterized membrane-anchored protein